MDPKDILNAALSVLGIIISFFIGRHYHKKNQVHMDFIMKTERSRIKTDYSNQLAEQVVQSVLNNENLMMDLDRVRACVNGQMITQTHDSKELSEAELSDVIKEAIAQIDKQKFISKNTKDGSILFLLNLLISIKKGWKTDTAYRSKYFREISIFDEGQTYLLSLITAFIIIIYLITLFLGFNSTILSLFCWIMVVIISYASILSFNGFVLNDNWAGYIKAHTLINAVLLFLIIVGSTVGELVSEEPLLVPLFFVIQVVTWFLPFTIAATFIFVKIKQYYNRNLNAE